ncbi:hypothetical protein D3C87_1013150 [compost metagenome]
MSRGRIPVETASTFKRAVSPSFMIEPLPNCFSIPVKASSSALRLSEAISLDETTSFAMPGSFLTREGINKTSVSNFCSIGKTFPTIGLRNRGPDREKSRETRVSRLNFLAHSMYSTSWRSSMVCFSLASALPSIWRTRSRVTPKIRPISSSV